MVEKVGKGEIQIGDFCRTLVAGRIFKGFRRNPSVSENYKTIIYYYTGTAGNWTTREGIP
jgi:hypothetical protein